MIKPILIYVTAETSNENSYVAQVLELLYEILMFCTISALAYITFNKKYKIIDKMNTIMYNAHLFGKTYIASYLISIISTYSILIFIILFTWGSNAEIKKFQWDLVIYPQCFWLLFVKLYHNELSHMITLLIFIQKKNKGDIKIEWLENDKLGIEFENDDRDSVSLNIQVLEYYKRLFVYQIMVWLAALTAIGYYIFFLFGGKSYNVTNYNDKSVGPWQTMYLWQLILGIAISIVMPLSMKMSWNVHIHA